MKKYLMTIRSGIDKHYATSLDLPTPDQNIWFYSENDEKANEWRYHYLDQLKEINTPFVSDFVVIE